MQKCQYAEEQIIGILKQHETGGRTADVCREHGINAATFYDWKSISGPTLTLETLDATMPHERNSRFVYAALGDIYKYCK